MEIANKEVKLTSLAQAFLKASEMEQTEDSITIRFEGPGKKNIIPAMNNMTEILDEIDEKRFLHEIGLDEDEEEEDREY